MKLVRSSARGMWQPAKLERGLLQLSKYQQHAATKEQLPSLALASSRPAAPMLHTCGDSCCSEKCSS